MVKLFAENTTEDVCIMGYIHCCGALRKTRSFMLAPTEGFVVCELDYLEQCPACGNLVIQLTRIDEKFSVSVLRFRNLKAKKFFERVKNKILYEENTEISVLSRGRTFYLGYNEFGIKKKCYSNFSNLKIGLS